MPLQIFFVTGEGAPQERHLIREVGPGIRHIFWDFVHPADSSPSSTVLAAECARNDQATQVYEFDRHTAGVVDSKGNPLDFPYVPDHVLTPDSDPQSWVVTSTIGVVGRLMLVHTSST